MRGTDIPIKKLMNDKTEGEVIYLDGHLAEIWRVRQLRRNVSVLLVLLSCCSFCYYFINLFIKNISPNLVQNTIIS